MSARRGWISILWTSNARVQQHAFVLCHEPAAVQLLRNEVGTAAGVERRADPRHARYLQRAELEDGVVRDSLGVVDVRVFRVEQLERGFVERIGDAPDLRERPRAVATELAVALRKTEIEDAAQLGGLLALADAMPAHEFADALGDGERFR